MFLFEHWEDMTDREKNKMFFIYTFLLELAYPDNPED